MTSADHLPPAAFPESYVRDYGGTSTRFLNLPELMQRLLAGEPSGQRAVMVRVRLVGTWW